MQGFFWLPSYTPKLVRKPRVVDSSLGDGYRQRLRDGINTLASTWTLNFDARDQDEAEAIIDFLDGLAGADAFTWLDPTGALFMWICQDYGLSRTSPLLYQVTATFERVFDVPAATSLAIATDIIITG